MNAKVEEMINKGKAAAQTGYDKGNGLMDKVPALKSKRNKLIVWGVLAVVLVLIFKAVFCGGSSDPFDVAKETMVAMVEGDLETVFSNIYIPAEEKERIAKLSDAELEVFEKSIVEGFLSAFKGTSEEELKLMHAAFSSMECKDVKIEGDKAKVTVRITAMGESNEQVVVLKKDDGDWKVDFKEN